MDFLIYSCFLITSSISFSLSLILSLRDVCYLMLASKFWESSAGRFRVAEDCLADPALPLIELDLTFLGSIRTDAPALVLNLALLNAVANFYLKTLFRILKNSRALPGFFPFLLLLRSFSKMFLYVGVIARFKMFINTLVYLALSFPSFFPNSFLIFRNATLSCRLMGALAIDILTIF